VDSVDENADGRSDSPTTTRSFPSTAHRNPATPRPATLR